MMRSFHTSSIFAGLTLLALLASCGSLAKEQKNKILVTPHLYTISSDLPMDSAAEALIVPYRDSVARQMNRVIGHATSDLAAFAPESPLSNFVADLLLQDLQTMAKQNQWPRPHLSLINIRGLRGMIPAGEITVGRIFQVMPFENQMVLVKLTGQQMMELFAHMATFKGDGVSGARFVIQANQTIGSATIEGEPVNADKTYWVATSDYLANGGDHYAILTKGETIELGITIRDLMIRHIEQLTANHQKIETTTDERISYEK